MTLRTPLSHYLRGENLPPRFALLKNDIMKIFHTPEWETTTVVFTVRSSAVVPRCPYK